MMKKANGALTVLFLVFISIGALSAGFIGNVEALVRLADGTVRSLLTDGPMDTDTLDLDVLTDNLTDTLAFKNNMVDYCGFAMKFVGVRSFYNNSYGINVTRNGYVVNYYNKTSTDYEVEQMLSFKAYLDEKGINLLYVSEPVKYTDDDFFFNEFGEESWVNRNTDLFLRRIGEAGIDYIDLRENCGKDGIDCLDLFYRTDHHWTVPASRWAAEIIAEHLNEACGYSIPVGYLYGEDNYKTTEYKNVWLGEQGRKVGQSYIGLDDYTLMVPLYETSFTFYKDGEVVAEGPFETFINYDRINTEVDPSDTGSWHYAYQIYPNKANVIHNNMVTYGKVLLLGDSYENTLAPFLALGIRDMVYKQPRYMKTSVRDVIEDGDFDTVIIAYPQSMIGAHDNRGSANYSQFTLE